MKYNRAYMFKLEEDGQPLTICETENGQSVELIYDGGSFFLGKEEATKIAQLIDPNSYANERIRYSPNPTVEDYGRSYKDTNNEDI